MIICRLVLSIGVFIGVFIVLQFIAVATFVVGVASRFRSRPEKVTGTVHTVVASIVIPTWNGRDLLESCLPSIVDDVAATEGRHEIIVVDNASTDESGCLIAEQFPSVRVVRLETNEGFGEGCNAGARAARGRYLVVLNNDMKVEPGFLRELLAGFQNSDVFAVTAQIFFWADAQPREETGLTRGGFSGGQLWVTHDQPVDDPWETYPAVFYAGGGSTAYDRDKYLTIGGFDHLYHPFYVEDVDLSYRAWRRGWPSVFAPRARVLHKHRGTIGKLFDQRFIADVIERNRLLFTWRNVSDPDILTKSAFIYSALSAAGAIRGRLNLRPFLLAVTRLPTVLSEVWQDRRNDTWSDDRVARITTDRIYYRDCFAPLLAPSAGARLKIVVMSPYAMFPPRHGGATRVYNIVKRLATRHSVRVVSFVDTEEEQREMAELEALGIEVTTVLRRPEFRRYNTFGSDPLCVVEFDMPQMREALRSPAIAEVDVFHVEYTQLAHFIRPSRHILNVLAEVDVSFWSLYRGMRQQPWPVARIVSWFAWLKMFNHELDVCQRSDLVLAVSQDEADLLRSYLPTHPISAAAPTGVDVSYFQPRDWETVQQWSVLFVGYFRHPPNVDAVLELGRTIFPLLKAKYPDATLTIVGAHPPRDVRELASDPAIRVLGYVDDLRDYYRTHAALAAPIRTGAGTRVKILEAMAAGVPVVTTTIGAEGIQCQAGVDILIADDPERFATELGTILTSPAYARSIAVAGRHLVMTRYDWDAIVKNLEHLYVQGLRKKRVARGHSD